MAGKQNKFTYFENEKSKLEMIQDMNRESASREYRRFNVDLEEVKRKNPKEYAKLVANLGAGFVESGAPGAQAVIGATDTVANANETRQLHGSTLSGLGAIGSVNEVGAIASSDRLSIIGKIGEFFSWIGDRLGGFVKSIIPFGNMAVGVTEGGVDSYKKYKKINGETSYDRDDVENLFHLQDVMTSEQDIADAHQKIADVLDQNNDGEVDELEMKTAHALLDRDNDGRISENEIKRHGGWEGALAFIQAHHKEVIDAKEYDDAYGRLVLRDKIGRRANDFISEHYKKLDVDGDGVVSRAEFRGALAVFDKNGDHVITDAEIEPYRDNPEQSLALMVNHLKNNGGGRS